MRTTKLLTVVLFAFFIALSSCKKDGSATFTLLLKAKYGTQNFEMNSDYTDASNRYIQFSNLKFYLSHINLVKSDGSTVKVSDVAFFDLNDTTNLSISVKNVQGDFTGISFACGLDSLTNDTTDPNAYLPPNPLSGSYDMYWPMIKYQFEVLEGKWDTAALPIMRNGLVYHIGTNPAYRTTRLNKAFSISGNPYTVTLYLDVAQIFTNTTTNQTLDISTEPSSQSGPSDNPVIMPTFANNFSNSFSIQ